MRLPNAATNTRTERHVVIRLHNNCSMSNVRSLEISPIEAIQMEKLAANAVVLGT